MTADLSLLVLASADADFIVEQGYRARARSVGGNQRHDEPSRMAIPKRVR